MFFQLEKEKNSKNFWVGIINIHTSFRGYFIINPEGVIRGRTVSDLPVAIHTNHLVRQVFNKNILDCKVKEN